jgi:site-specific DNA recombinase
MESKTVVLYARSATFKRPEENNSVQMQLEKLREYARKNDYEVLAEFVDEGVSGLRIDHPGLQEMISRIKNEHDIIGAVLVWDFARLSRRSFLVHNLKKVFREVGVRVISVCEPCIEESEAARLFMDRMLLIIDEAFSGSSWRE